MNLDARLKKVEERAQERMMANFCLCVLDRELSAIYRQYLAVRGIVYELEDPYIVESSCTICGGAMSADLTQLNEEERDVRHRLADLTKAGWAERRRTGRPPEIPEEFTKLEKWLRRRYRMAEERMFGKHGYAASMFAYRRAKSCSLGPLVSLTKRRAGTKRQGRMR